jgi:hypothetical protein
MLVIKGGDINISVEKDSEQQKQVNQEKVLG